MRVDILNSKEYSTARAELQSILKQGKLSQSSIDVILSIDNKLIISDFLEQYLFFDEEDIVRMENYIINNIGNSDRLFVSDLIEFATYWEIELSYDLCINLLGNYKDDDHYVLLAVMSYIFENMKLAYIDDIVKGLIKVVNNSDQLESALVKAYFILFRVTQKKDYLTSLINLVEDGNQKELLSNILKLEYNRQEYFDYHDFLKGFCLN